MAQLSKRARRLARVRRENSQLHRSRRQLLTEAAPIMRRANVEGRLLRLILEHTPVTLHTSEMGRVLVGEIDVAPIPDTEYYEIRYLPTPVEALRAVDTPQIEWVGPASPESDDSTINLGDDSNIVYAGPAQEQFYAERRTPIDPVVIDVSYAEPEAAV